MFKIASKNNQARLRRATPEKFGDFDINPTDIEQYENLVKRYQALNEEVIKYPKGSHHRKQIGCELFGVQEEIKKLKPKITVEKEFDNFLIGYFRRKLGEEEFYKIRREAKELYLKGLE